MSLTQKNPNHSGALRLKDITPGRQVILFSLGLGVLEHLTITSRPRVELVEIMEKPIRSLMIDAVGSKGHVTFFATDLGLLPYDKVKNKWNPFHFLVDKKKQHTLPAPDTSLVPNIKAVAGGFLDSYGRWASD